MPSDRATSCNWCFLAQVFEQSLPSDLVQVWVFSPALPPTRDFRAFGSRRGSMVEGDGCHRIAAEHRRALLGRKMTAKSPNGKFKAGAQAINSSGGVWAPRFRPKGIKRGRLATERSNRFRRVSVLVAQWGWGGHPGVPFFRARSAPLPRRSLDQDRGARKEYVSGMVVWDPFLLFLKYTIYQHLPTMP